MFENYLRAKYNPLLAYKEAFIIHYLKKIIYLDVNPILVTIVTAFTAVYTIVTYVIRPPRRFKEFFKPNLHSERQQKLL